MTGINRYADLVKVDGSVYKICQKAKVDRSNVSAAKMGRRALSLATCKRLAEVDSEIKPVALYLQSVARVAKARIDGAHGGPAAAIAAIQAAVAKLQALPRDELLLEGDELTEAVQALEALIGDAMTNATPASGTRPEAIEPVTRKSQARDPFGRILPEPKKVERDPFSRRMAIER